jgi:hypothetical protein
MVKGRGFTAADAGIMAAAKRKDRIKRLMVVEDFVID